MKQRFFAPVLFAAAVSFSALFPAPVFAADPLQVAPDMYKLLFENENVRVMEVTFKPGQKIPEHTHPNHHFVVVEKPGKLKISKPGGHSEELELKQKQIVWIPAETHWAENTGTTEVQLLVSEVKGGAPATIASKALK